MSVKDYHTEADLNLSIAGISVAEGCAPSGMNDAIRQLMADAKEEQEAREASEEALAEAVSALETELSGRLEESASSLSSSMSAELDKKLDKAGGTLEGTLKKDGTAVAGVTNGSAVYFNGGADAEGGATLGLFGLTARGRISLYGGMDNVGGAALNLFAKSHGTSPGWVQLVARDGTSTTAFLLKPDGSATCGGRSLSTYDLTGRATLLFNEEAGLPQGDITLSQPYTDFSALVILYGGDTPYTWMSTKVVSVWELQQRKAKGTTSFVLVDGISFWILRPETTATTLVHYDDNCRIYAIWGIK